MFLKTSTINDKRSAQKIKGGKKSKEKVNKKNVNNKVVELTEEDN